MNTDDLVTWLLMQLDAEERGVENIVVGRERAVAEVDAKRRILEEVVLCDLSDDPDDQTALHLLKLLALPYAARPGYRSEWRPE